jgi:hypothetical protein
MREAATEIEHLRRKLSALDRAIDSLAPIEREHVRSRFSRYI